MEGSKIQTEQKKSRPVHVLMGLILGIVPLGGATVGQAEEAPATGSLPFTDPYAFVDRFTDSPEVKALGFPIGPKPFLNLGMVVEKEEAERAGTPVDIVSATASNGKITFELVYADIGILDLWDNWDEIPVFNPETHTGAWMITAVDSDGRSATTEPVLLEYGIDMPFVENVAAEATASGDLRVTWLAPELDPEIKEKCDVDYRLRLLQTDTKQFYRSDQTTETSVTVPADTLTEKVGGDLDGVWARVEMTCRDKKQKDEDGVGEAEARSNTFVPLS